MKVPNYEWKPLSELVRAVALAAIVFLAIALVGLASVHDWATYAVTFGTGLASAVGTAILGVLTNPAASVVPPTPPPAPPVVKP